MSVKKEKIYIIKAHTINDADRIIVFLTESGKKKSGVAKNALKLKSRFAGKVEPYSFCEFEYYEKNKDSNNLCSINSATLLKSCFKSVGGDMGKFTALSLINEIIDNFVFGIEGSSKIFRLVEHCLDNLTMKGNNIHLPLSYFIFWILKLSGNLSEFKTCGVCDKKLSEFSLSYFDNKEFFCENHSNKGLKITKDVIEMFEKIEKNPLKNIEIDNIKIKEVFSTVINILTIYAEKDFKSYNLLKTFI